MRKVIPIHEDLGLFHEPTLAEILSDPIVEAVMRADSVDLARLTDMLGWIADELQANVPNPACFGEGRRPISTLARAATASRGA
jgi:hypothetical protein